jgi:heme/copper-type cytochrome/quinol oxidase subunit 2
MRELSGMVYDQRARSTDRRYDSIMERSKWLKFVIAVFLPLILLLFLTLAASHKAHADVVPPIIDIMVERFAFAPSPIILNKGETVKIRLHNEDVTHSFFMGALKEDRWRDSSRPRKALVNPPFMGETGLKPCPLAVCRTKIE